MLAVCQNRVEKKKSSLKSFSSVDLFKPPFGDILFINGGTRVGRAPLLVFSSPTRIYYKNSFRGRGEMLIALM